MADIPDAHSNEEGEPLTERINVYAPPRLKDLAAEAANSEGVALSEFVVRVLARHFKRPELGIIPRKPPGRRPTVSRRR